jgi:hypothetical protein
MRFMILFMAFIPPVQATEVTTFDTVKSSEHLLITTNAIVVPKLQNIF